MLNKFAINEIWLTVLGIIYGYFLYMVVFKEERKECCFDVDYDYLSFLFCCRCSIKKASFILKTVPRETAHIGKISWKMVSYILRILATNLPS